VDESTVFPSPEFCPAAQEILAKVGTVILPCPPPASGKLYIGINPDFDSDFPLASPEFFLRLVQTVSPKRVITRIFDLNDLRGISLPAPETPDGKAPRVFRTVGQFADAIQDRKRSLKAARRRLQSLAPVSDPSDLPASGKNLIILALVGGVFHLRVFDNDGDKIVDTDETQLPGKAKKIREIRSKIPASWNGDEIGMKDQDCLIAAVISLFCQCPEICPGVYEVCLHEDAVVYVRESAPVLLRFQYEYGVTAEESAEYVCPPFDREICPCPCPHGRRRD
jgi:hypothetical protein